MKIEDLQYPFWIASGKPGASDLELQVVEARLDQRLPLELVKALKIQNGGVSVYSGFRRGDYYVPLPPFFSTEEMFQAYEHASEFGTPKGVIAIAGGGHEWLGLDYRASHEPSVVFQESEDDELEVVSSSFEQLLVGLTEE